MRKDKTLRGLSRAIMKVVHGHPEMSRAFPIINMACEHLCAIARIEELDKANYALSEKEQARGPR